MVHLCYGDYLGSLIVEDQKNIRERERERARNSLSILQYIDAYITFWFSNLPNRKWKSFVKKAGKQTLEIKMEQQSFDDGGDNSNVVGDGRVVKEPAEPSGQIMKLQGLELQLNVSNNDNVNVMFFF